MRFRLFGTEIYVSFFFSAVITAMLAFDRTGYILPLLFAVTVHELSHLTVMWICDCAPLRIRLVPAAVEITTRIKGGIGKEIMIALAGPLINIFLFFALWLNFLAFGNKDYLIFGLINLLIGAFNLLPVTGLDGGTVLEGILIKRINPAKAGVIMKIMNLTVAAVLIFFAVYFAFKGQFNLSLFIIPLYLAIVSLIKL